MINYYKLIKNFKDPNFGLNVPSLHTQKLINNFPSSRVDTELKREYTLLKTSSNQIRLNEKEKICLNMLMQKSNMEERVNEIGHLYFIAKQENQRTYFLNNLDILNPSDHKMSDIYVPGKNKKYEVKSYNQLELLKAKRLIYQYGENNFHINDIHFNIVFNDSKCTIDEFKEKLSNNLRIPKTNITILSQKDFCEEINVNSLLKDLYNINIALYKQEYETSLWENIYKCTKYTKHKTDQIGSQLSELCRGHENETGIDKKTKRLLNQIKIPKFHESTITDINTVENLEENSSNLEDNNSNKPSSGPNDVD